MGPILPNAELRYGGEGFSKGKKKTEERFKAPLGGGRYGGKKMP